MRRLAIAVLLTCSAGVPPALAENDLSVAWIARTPRIDYIWNGTNPTREGWPAQGSTVKWEANVRWLGDSPVNNVGYRWRVDGSVAQSGTLDFGPRSLVTNELAWTWTFDRHEIVFEIDAVAGEIEPRNNRLLIHSNALGVGIYVERGFRDGIEPALRKAKFGVSTFDDWMQRQIRRFNEMAAYTIYPDTPDGVLDRWRIDEIHLVEDGALPLNPPFIEARNWGVDTKTGMATAFPDVLDHTVDMQWGFPADTVSFWPNADAWVFMNGNSIVHELAHARMMIDTYAWNVAKGQDAVNITPAPASQNSWYYSTRENGLMHFGWGHIDRYSAAAMNRMAGQRATAGNYNEPWNIGWFLNDLSTSNRVQFIRPDRTPIANSSIRIFRASGETIDWRNESPYKMVFDDTADYSLRTDGSGFVDLPQNPFTDGQIVAAVERANGVAIVEITDGGTLRWAYLDSLQFNLAFWRGDTEIIVMADAPLCFDSAGGPAVPGLESVVTTREVTFQFPTERNRTYDLYYAVNGGPAVRTSVTSTPVKLNVPAGRVVWWYVDPNPAGMCLPKHSSTYGFDHEYETHPKRRVVKR